MYLATGASGFIAQHLLDTLTKRGLGFDVPIQGPLRDPERRHHIRHLGSPLPLSDEGFGGHLDEAVRTIRRNCACRDPRFDRLTKSVNYVSSFCPIMAWSMRTRLLALLFSIPLVASGAAGVALHVCQSMGGMVIGDCDCEKPTEHGAHSNHGDGAEHAAGQADTKLQSQPCCTVELSNANDLRATQKLSWQQFDQGSVARLSPREHGVPASREACDLGLLRERAPPNIHGPPLFIRNCSFLN
jgi:hypothetical protein